MSAHSLCPICGSTDIRVESPGEFNYENIGLSSVLLTGGGGVQIVHCCRCEDATTFVREEQQLLQVLGLMIVTGPLGMTGEELRYLRTLFEMTQSELATALVRSRRETITEWEGRDRIFAVPAEEISTRLLLSELYEIRLIDSDHCFLEASHLEQYRESVSSFVEHSSRMLRGEFRRSGHARLDVRRPGANRPWTPQMVVV